MRTQDHNAVLDGLRGFAAIAVLVYHLGHWFGIPGIAANSGLAVDFFFCLSGYVLAMAYRRRLDTDWGLIRFIEVRLVRLMPLIIVGTLISAAYVAFRMVAKHEAGHETLAIATGLGLIDIPYLGAPKVVGGPQVFPLNGPQYSLFLEIVVNAFWGATTLMRKRGPAVALTIAGIVGVALLGLGGDEASNFWDGFPRVFGSFYLGTLTFLAGPWIRQRIQFLFPVGLVSMFGLFLWPEDLPIGVVIIWIAVLSPIVVATGAGVRLPERLRPAALLSGRLSFPIYALHYPLFCWINGLVQIRTHRQIPTIEIPIVLVAVPLLAWALLAWYDEPVRRVLDARIKALRTARAS